jgi:hypothetical protein
VFDEPKEQESRSGDCETQDCDDACAVTVRQATCNVSTSGRNCNAEKDKASTKRIPVEDVLHKERDNCAKRGHDAIVEIPCQLEISNIKETSSQFVQEDTKQCRQKLW